MELDRQCRAAVRRHCPGFVESRGVAQPVHGRHGHGLSTGMKSVANLDSDSEAPANAANPTCAFCVLHAQLTCDLPTPSASTASNRLIRDVS